MTPSPSAAAHRCDTISGVPNEYYVYIMTGRSGVFYTGITNHIIRRAVEHREGRCGFTWKYRLNRLVYFDATNDVREAIAFEKRLKRWPRAKKIALIKRSNPWLLDLAETILGLPPLLELQTSSEGLR